MKSSKLISIVSALLLPSGLSACFWGTQPALASPVTCNPYHQGYELTPKQVQEIAQNITVRITAENNGGSGVIIAKKGNTYLALTNKHVADRATKFQLQTCDGQKYTAQIIPNSVTKINPKYDLALLQFTSTKQYELARLENGSLLTPGNPIYSGGYPFDSNTTRISIGKVSQLSDIPLDDGTQMGYKIDANSPQVKQGMSGGIVDLRGVLLGINTIGSHPLVPSYTYNDGSHPDANRAREYTKSNWGVPVYNFLTQLDSNLVYEYKNFPKVQRQISPTGYLARLNQQMRQQTVRVETDAAGNGSGTIIAKQGNTYYVLTARHAVSTMPEAKRQQLHAGIRLVTYDQASYQIQPSNITLAEGGVDLAVVKFTTTNNYRVAQIGNYSPQNAIVFVGGYPARERLDSPLWQWQLNPGTIADREQGKIDAQDKTSFASGYELKYTSVSYGGMSGGGVFDTEGRLVGIHGKGEGSGIGSSRLSDVSALSSLGLPIQAFIDQLDKLQVPKLGKLDTQQPKGLSVEDIETVAEVQNNVSPPPKDGNQVQWLEYGSHLYRIGKYPAAVKAFDIAIAKGADPLVGNYGRARAYDDGGDKTQALVAIDKAIGAVAAEDRQRYYYLWKYRAVILRDSEKYAEALKSLDEAIKLEPSDLTLVNERAVILEGNNQYREALKAYDFLIDKQPTAAYAYVNRGVLKDDKLNNSNGALADFNHAIALNPNLALAYNNRGVLKDDKLNDPNGALADYNRAIALNPNLAFAYNNRGVLKYEKLNDPNSALADYNRAIALNPNLAQAYNNRGLLKKDKLNDPNGALADYNRAIALNPNYADTYYNRGNLKKDKLNDPNSALADYNRAIALNPNDAKAYNNRGNLKYKKLNDPNGALADYNRAIALNPNDADAYNNRGNLKYEKLNDPNGALADYNRAIALNPNYADAYYNRGIVKYEKLNDRPGGIADTKKAIDLARAQGNTQLLNGALKILAIMEGK